MRSRPYPAAVPNPHDALFRRTFGNAEHAVGLLRSMLPQALADAADWSTLQLRDGSFVDPSLAERHSDLLYAVKLAGRDAFVYAVLEHQSSSDPWMTLRMLGYLVRVYERLRQERGTVGHLPFVFPIVVHHSETGWSASTAFADILDLDPALLEPAAPFVPNFRFALLDLTVEDDQSLHERLTTDLGRFIALTLKHAAYDPNFLDRLVHWAELIRRLLAAPGGLSGLSAAINYILEVTELPADAVRSVLESRVGSEASEALMSTAEKLRAEGRAEGRVAGRVEGRAELVLKLLTLRFGSLPSPIRARIEAASIEELDSFAERVLSARTLDEVLGSA
jgi:predicted transposase/invertase (TIGR01784 family)